MMQRREDIIRGSEKVLKEVENCDKMVNSGDGFDDSVFDFTDDESAQEKSFPRVGTVKNKRSASAASNTTSNVPAMGGTDTSAGAVEHGNGAESRINQLNDILAGDGTNNLEEFPLDNSNVGENEDVPPVVDENVQPGPAIAGNDTIRKQFREYVNYAHREHGNLSREMQAGIELMHQFNKEGASLALFDKTTQWRRDHSKENYSKEDRAMTAKRLHKALVK